MPIGLGAVRPRVAPMVVHADERSRDAGAPWRRWYKTARWQALRWSVLVEADFICAMCKAEHSLTPVARLLRPIGHAGRIDGKAPDRVADHVQPHRGDPGMFWDRDNLQCLCKACHDRFKQSQERRG